MASREDLKAYPKHFCPRFIKLLRLSGLGADDVCAEFSVSKRTIERWADGRTAPHPLLGSIVLQWLERKAAAAAKRTAEE